MPETYGVVVAAGSYRSQQPDAVRSPHRWTDEGVTIEAPFTGVHMLHVAVAGCVLNDFYREARRLDIPVAGVRVTALGDYLPDWALRGLGYRVELDTDADEIDQIGLLAVVDELAEIPRALRGGGRVERID